MNDNLLPSSPAACAARLLPLLLLLALPVVVQAQFTFTTNNGALTITAPSCLSGAVAIPSATNGYPITSIANNAFQNCATLTSITIPDSITNIGNYGFQDCTSLTNVTIGTNVTSIGLSAFWYCTSLTNITIPASVTNIGAYVFGNCTSLAAITVDTNNPAYSSLAGVLFDKSQTTLIECPGGMAGSYTIPASVTNIGTYAFLYCTSLASVTISNSVTSLGNESFEFCFGLTNVTIGTNVASIGNQAFWYCPALTSITIPAAVTNIGAEAFGYGASLSGITVDPNNPAYSSVAGVLFNKSQTTLIQYPGGKVGSYTIPNSVITIGDNAFYYCTRLTSVTIGTNVTSIAYRPFCGCASLTNVTIPASVTSIGDDAFQNCSSLAGVYFQGNAPSADSTVFSGDNNATVCYCPGTTGWSATFGGLPALNLGLRCTTNNSTITITGYTNVGGPVIIPGTITGYPVASIGNCAFSNCTGVTSVSIPDSVTNLGDYAFEYCSSLTNAMIGNSVTNIGSWAFEWCGSLTSVTIGTNVTSIGYGAFFYCTGLASVTIPTNVTSIGTEAFCFCSSLASVTIPSSVTNIGSYPFWYTPKLTAITVDTNNPAYSSVAEVLFNKSQTVLVEAPGGLAGSYTVPDSVTNIGSDAFVYCTSLTSVTIPNSVTSIGKEAFVLCGYRLTSVMIGSGVTSIGNDAFYGDSGLTAITVDANNPAFSSLGGVLFDKNRTTLLACPGMSGRYEIPNGVTSIGYDAFGGNTRLNSVTIPATVTNIVNNAFWGSSQLTGVYFRGQPPTVGSSVFFYDNNVMVYYLPGSTGWNPQVQTSGASFGVRTNRFGFTITGNSNLGIVVQACTNLAHPAWCPVATNTLAGGSCYFCDPQWTNYTRRFYRLGGLTFAGLPAVLWNPQVQTSGASFGVRTNRFGFNITGSSNLVIVVEACTNLANAVWSPVSTNTLTGGCSYFSDPQWTNYARRFYRLRSP